MQIVARYQFHAVVCLPLSLFAASGVMPGSKLHWIDNDHGYRDKLIFIYLILIRNTTSSFKMSFSGRSGHARVQQLCSWCDFVLEHERKFTDYAILCQP